MLNSTGNAIKLFITNPILLACLSSWICAQFIKTVVSVLTGKIHSFVDLIENLFWKTGGLPSSHSALVTCLCTSIGFRTGVGSDIFILAFCFLLVTVRDAMGVRLASGLQSKKINELGKDLEEKGLINYKPLKEIDGHTPLQVTLGCLLGFFIAIAFAFL